MATNPLATFGQTTPVGTPGPTTKQLGTGFVSSLGSLNGNASTVPFAAGGTTTPSAVGSFAASNPTSSNNVGAPAKSPASNLSVQSNSAYPSMLNLTQSNGQVGNLTSVPNGTPFNYAGLTYIKDSNGNITPYNGAGTTGNPNATTANTQPSSADSSGYGLTVQEQQAAQNQPSANTNPYTATAPSYSGLVGSLASTAAQPSSAFTQAQQTAQQALSALQESQSNEAQALSMNSQNPIPIEFQQGRSSILQLQYGQQQAALANELQGAAQLEGAATTQQSAQQTGLGAAAGLTAPQQVSPTNVPYNPTTGTYGTPAANAYGTNGLQSVGNIQGQINVGQNVAQLNSALGGAQVVGNNLTSLIQSAGINPNDVNFLNAINQYLQTGVLSNSQYQKFAGQVNDFITSLAPILGAGGSATDFKTQLSQQIVNAQASGQSMTQVIQYFLQQAQQKLQGMSAGGGVTPGSSGSNTSGSNFYSSNWFS